MSSRTPILEAGRSALAAADWSAAQGAFEGLGWAHWWQDRASESLDARERAHRLFVQAGDGRAAGRLAYGIGSFDDQGGAVMNGWLQRSRRHLDALEPCAEHGWLALWEGHSAAW